MPLPSISSLLPLLLRTLAVRGRVRRGRLLLNHFGFSDFGHLALHDLSCGHLANELGEEGDHMIEQRLTRFGIETQIRADDAHDFARAIKALLGRSLLEPLVDIRLCEGRQKRLGIFAQDLEVLAFDAFVMLEHVDDLRDPAPDLLRLLPVHLLRDPLLRRNGRPADLHSKVELVVKAAAFRFWNEIGIPSPDVVGGIARCGVSILPMVLHIASLPFLKLHEQAGHGDVL